MLTPLIGPEYSEFSDDITPEHFDCTPPTRVVCDGGLRSLINSCHDDETQADLALEATMTLYPPLVCKCDALPGGVTVNVIGN